MHLFGTFEILTTREKERRGSVQRKQKFRLFSLLNLALPETLSILQPQQRNRKFIRFYVSSDMFIASWNNELNSI